MPDAPSPSLTLRLAQASDQPQLLDLIEQANWNQTARDWQNLMTLAPQGVWVMDDQGKAVASVSVMTYPAAPGVPGTPGTTGRSIGWIGMLIVDSQHRRMGIATRLLDHSVALALQSCESVKLDATEDGRHVYQQHGFVDEYTLVRLTSGATWPVDGHQATGLALIQQIQPAEMERVIAMDRVTFGADRTGLLRQLYTDAPQLAMAAWRDHVLVGFCLGRTGRRYTQIGPVQAKEEQVGVELIRAAAAQADGRPLVVDVLESHTLLMESLAQMGFTPQRRLYRMFYKANPCPGLPEQSLAVAGYEFG